MKRALIINPLLTISACIFLSALPSGSVYAGHFASNKATIITDTARVNLLEIRHFNLVLIPPSSGIRYYRSGIIFLSYSKNAEKMITSHVSFGDLKGYQASVKDTTIGLPSEFATSLKFRYPCEGVTFSTDYNTMYYTMLSPKDKKEKIYKAEYTSGGNKERGWITDPDPVNFCTDNNIFTHPALSGDGKTMVFCSDMGKTSGGLDLYMSRLQGDTWSSPENLGTIINSSGNELYPSFDGSDNLYFSSDGLPGNGGYDVFMCLNNGKSWGKPHNLSKMINSQDDDIAFIIDRSTDRSAFITRVDPADKRNMNLFQIGLNVLSKRTDNLTTQFMDITGQKAVKEVIKPEPSTAVASNIQPKQDQKSQTVKNEAAVKQQPAAKPEEVKGQEAQAKPVNAKPQEQPAAASEPKKDIIVYRVQIKSTSGSAGSTKVTVAGKSYDTYEYTYMGANRVCVGEFTTFAEAVKFQSQCRQSGFTQSFVVVFKNNVRSTDPALFK